MNDDTKEYVKVFEKGSIEYINQHIKATGLEFVLSCKHENDGYAYPLGTTAGIKLPSLPRTPYNFKCKHCGEFYK